MCLYILTPEFPVLLHLMYKLRITLGQRDFINDVWCASSYKCVKTQVSMSQGNATITDQQMASRGIDFNATHTHTHTQIKTF